jgi:hypothetical protein
VFDLAVAKLEEVARADEKTRCSDEGWIVDTKAITEVQLLIAD